MKIRKVLPEELPKARAFYHAVIDGIQDRSTSVKWQKDVYPNPGLIENSIRREEFFAKEKDGEFIAAMILNHAFPEEYRRISWPTKAEKDEVMIIHALAVHPLHTRKGYAKDLVRFAVEYGRKNRQKAIRLDVLKENAAAEKLYPDMGFQYAGSVRMFYEDTGWADFLLYEFPLCGL